MSMRANGAAIRVIRERTGISLSTLATRIEIDKGQLSRIETGASRGSPAVLRALADSLGVPLEAITNTAPEPQEVAS